MVRGGMCPIKGHPAGRRPDPALSGFLAPIQFPPPPGMQKASRPGLLLDGPFETPVWGCCPEGLSST